ncbi:hypothetical protein LTR17_026149 [Elasticomyces elasticus]|nr:hypothetical protein LTR17_026149 [Elasticomyces elasticus]
MPHGVLTPLGRQLRTVLAGLGRTRAVGWSGLGDGRIRRTRGLNAHDRAYHGSYEHGLPVTVVQEAWFDDAPTELAAQEPQMEPRKRVLKRRTRRSFLTEALRAAGKEFAVARVPNSKHDLSHVNVRKIQGWTQHKKNMARHRLEYVPSLARTTDLTLERLVASHIQHMNTIKDTGQAEWDAPYRLSFRESSFLSRLGYGKSDIETWARIVSHEDSLAAAKSLGDLIDAHSRKRVPLFLVTFLLRRRYLKPRALHTVLEVVPRLLDEHVRRFGSQSRGENTFLLVFIRLIRHAREVWTAALPAIAELILKYSPKVSAANIRQIGNLTAYLNKAMSLMSLETAVSPFQDKVYQEAAVVCILRFMTEHKPQLQITREGYRAVTRIQLAQKKTASEQQWAELKALSWPPWKQDRTAMDAGITADEHGISTAAATLNRMQEAGYSPMAWERTARLLAGWDVDGTPTIQTRALLGTGFPRLHFDSAVWSARITTTRTAQEAWAAYLAFEDTQLPPSDDVHIAILQKLYGEEERQRQSNQPQASVSDAEQRRRLLPGDTKEVEPLPPSTHLYTYTRTPVPTVEAFVGHLRNRGIQLKNHVLAFVVARAPRLGLSLEYLRGSIAQYPDIANLLWHGPRYNTNSIPESVFAAFIELLCRYSNVPWNGHYHRSVSLGPHFARPSTFDGQKLNPHHPLVLALELLRARGTVSRLPWNSVLRALGRDATVASMRFLRTTEQASEPEKDTQVAKSHGTILVHSLIRSTLNLMQNQHVDLDSKGLHYLCVATESATIACWTVLGSEAGSADDTSHNRAIVHEAEDILRRRFHTNHLKGQFWILVVGNQHEVKSSRTTIDSKHTHGSATRAPLPLLRVPSASLLHAYVRALGWAGEHSLLLELVQWMVLRKEDLHVQWEQERNGREALRLVIVALRVFLERTWLISVVRNSRRSGTELVHNNMGAFSSNPRPGPLQMLETPAPAEIIAEVKALLDGVGEWPSWPTDEEVVRYWKDKRFKQIRALM